MREVIPDSDQLTLYISLLQYPVLFMPFIWELESREKIIFINSLKKQSILK